MRPGIRYVKLASSFAKAKRRVAALKLEAHAPAKSRLDSYVRVAKKRAELDQLSKSPVRAIGNRREPWE